MPNDPDDTTDAFAFAMRAHHDELPIEVHTADPIIEPEEIRGPLGNETRWFAQWREQAGDHGEAIVRAIRDQLRRAHEQTTNNYRPTAMEIRRWQLGEVRQEGLELNRITGQQANALIIDEEQTAVPTTLFTTNEYETTGTEPHRAPSPTSPLTGIDESFEDIGTFTLQENSQNAEIRALTDEYPREIQRTDYQIPFVRAYSDMRQHIRDHGHELRRVNYARELFRNTNTDRERRLLETFIRPSLGRTNLAYVRNPDDISQEVLPIHEELHSHLRAYREQKARFIKDKKRFGPIQAEYNQRVAMIRQKPRKIKNIDCEKIVRTVSQWENVWGITIQHLRTEESLKIRVGLCGIVMSESAPTTRYDYAADIRLAPFYFTIMLSANGHFICPSQNYGVLGLSRCSGGELAYDIHPHQLTDSPCFGSFGQSFIDMAHTGEIVSLISGIIAFYSQYNSYDSAGVNAQYFHPQHLNPISNPARYKQALYSRLMRMSRLRSINLDKLEAATTNYIAYHNATRSKNAPVREDRHICAACDANAVNDDNEFYLAASGERVCPECWNDQYCGECEHHHEDCRCGDDDF